jgi:glutamyl/glutaminyl-tRNA synthetase
VVDDIDLRITHVIRGEDHVSNTGTQIEIFEALGGKVPAFAHHNLLTRRPTARGCQQAHRFAVAGRTARGGF